METTYKYHQIKMYAFSLKYFKKQQFYHMILADYQLLITLSISTLQFLNQEIK